MKKLALALPLLAILTGFSFAQEQKSLKLPPVVITATRFELSPDYIPEPVSVITSQEIERSDFSSLFDLLRFTSGFSLKRCGGPGQWTSVRLRGGTSGHLLLLLNGVRMSDPSTPSDDFGEILSYLDPSDISRIEVVEGPQSALYGSNAVSGVLNVITGSPTGRPSAAFKIEGGSLGRLRTIAKTGGRYGKLGYFLALSGERTGGVLEHEGFKDKTISSNLTYDLPANGKLSLFTRFLDAFVNYSEWNGRNFRAYDDPRAYKYTKSLFLSLGYDGKPTEVLSYSAKLSFNRTRRKYDDKDDGVLDAKDNVKDLPFEAHYKGTNLSANAQTVVKPLEKVKVMAGLDLLHQSAEAEFKDSTWTASPYLACNALLLDGSIALSLGARLDHGLFGTNPTYKLGAAYILKDLNLKLRGSFGTGFKAPSLYQMLSPKYGNRGLKPEKSRGLNMGAEKRFLKDKLGISLDLFKTTFRDMIAFESLFDEKGNWIGGRYANREKGESRGFELSLLAAPVRYLTVKGGYTYTDGKEGDKPLSLVPKHNLNLSSLITCGRLKGGLYIFKVGERLAYDHKHKLEGYTRVDLSCSYGLAGRGELFLKVENLLDADYEEAAGYKAPGLCLFGGIKLNI